MTPRRPWCTHSSSTGLTTGTMCFMGCRLYQLITAAVRDQLHCETTCGVQAGIIRVQGPPSDSSTVLCRHVSARVNEFHATPTSLGRSRESCGAAMQNNKIWKAKFSRVCSINLELTIPTTVRDVSISMNSFSRRLKAELFCRAHGTDLAPM